MEFRLCSAALLLSCAAGALAQETAPPTPASEPAQSASPASGPPDQSSPPPATDTAPPPADAAPSPTDATPSPADASAQPQPYPNTVPVKVSEKEAPLPKDNSPGASRLEEVTVTAQKVRQSVRDVPISMSV